MNHDPREVKKGEKGARGKIRPIPVNDGAPSQKENAGERMELSRKHSPGGSAKNDFITRYLNDEFFLRNSCIVIFQGDLR